MCEEGYLLDGNSSPPITTNIPWRIGEGSPVSGILIVFDSTTFCALAVRAETHRVFML